MTRFEAMQTAAQKPTSYAAVETRELIDAAKQII
jgi:hypothetical protein